MTSMTLGDLGWDTFFQQQVVDTALQGTPVRVMNVQRSGLHVVGETIDRHFELAGNDFSMQPTVGDWLSVDAESGRVCGVFDRKTLFKRRAAGTASREQLLAANVDTLFIVSSCNQDFNEARLERYLAIGREAQVMSVIVLTKMDLCDEPRSFADRAAKLASGVLVETVNALQHDSLQSLEPWLANGQTIALLGSSGVGKSTLTNTLLGAPGAATQSIRDDDAKGRHTTTARSMHRLPGGAWLVDTPGMRELQLTDVKAGLEDVFAEISAMTEHCRFADCQHEGEPGCAVRAAVESGEIDQQRLQRWRKLVREEALNSATIAERRARDKSFGKLVKSVMKDRKSRRGE